MPDDPYTTEQAWNTIWIDCQETSAMIFQNLMQGMQMGQVAIHWNAERFHLDMRLQQMLIELLNKGVTIL